MPETTLPMMGTNLQTLILDEIRKKQSPLTASELATNEVKSALGLKKTTSKAKTEPELLPHLDEMARSGPLFRFLPEKKNAKPVFFTEPVENLARRTIWSVIKKQQPVSWTDAKKSDAKGAKLLKPLSKFLLVKQQDQLLKEMVKDGSVFEWPKLGKKITKVLYSTQPADPSKYLDPALEKFRKELKALAGKLQSAGVRYDDLIGASRMALGGSAPPPAPPVEPSPEPAPPVPPPDRVDLSDLILEGMEKVKPGARNGASVTIATLRHAMEVQGLDKQTFDNEVLHLAERAVVDLHRYDYPAGLSQAERDEMVPDGQGGYYLAIARRV